MLKRIDATTCLPESFHVLNPSFKYPIVKLYPTSANLVITFLPADFKTSKTILANIWNQRPLQGANPPLMPMLIELGIKPVANSSAFRINAPVSLTAFSNCSARLYIHHHIQCKNKPVVLKALSNLPKELIASLISFLNP